jgi:hypothetical protein
LYFWELGAQGLFGFGSATFSGKDEHDTCKPNLTLSAELQVWLRAAPPLATAHA